MKELVINRNDAGQRLDKYLTKALPALPPSLLQKYIRLKRVKLSGKRVEKDYRLQEGDVLQLYISDEFFPPPIRRRPGGPSRPGWTWSMRTNTSCW